MLFNSRNKGAYFEKKARRYLEQKGLILQESNYHCRSGEIDLIMRDGDQLVFVEVRYRKHTAYGSGADSITPTKRRKIIKTAAFYLQCHGLTEQVSCRFDIISIDANENTLWLSDAFC